MRVKSLYVSPAFTGVVVPGGERERWNTTIIPSGVMFAEVLVSFQFFWRCVGPLPCWSHACAVSKSS